MDHTLTADHVGLEALDQVDHHVLFRLRRDLVGEVVLEEDRVDVVPALREQRVEDAERVRLVVVERQQDHAQRSSRRRSSEVVGLLLVVAAFRVRARLARPVYSQPGSCCQLAKSSGSQLNPLRRETSRAASRAAGIALDAVLALHQGLPAVELAADDPDPDAVGRVDRQVGARRQAFEALAAPAGHPHPVVAGLLAGDAELDHGARVGGRRGDRRRTACP